MATCAHSRISQNSSVDTSDHRRLPRAVTYTRKSERILDVIAVAVGQAHCATANQACPDAPPTLDVSAAMGDRHDVERGTLVVGQVREGPTACPAAALAAWPAA
jgi:hypothetical protein